MHYKDIFTPNDEPSPILSMSARQEKRKRIVFVPQVSVNRKDFFYSLGAFLVVYKIILIVSMIGKTVGQ